MSSPNTPRSSNENLKGIEISPELAKNLRKNFQELVTSLGERLENAISQMENGIHKKLLMAAYRRIMHIAESTNLVKEDVANKLHALLLLVEENKKDQNTPSTMQA